MPCPRCNPSGLKDETDPGCNECDGDGFIYVDPEKGPPDVITVAQALHQLGKVQDALRREPDDHHYRARLGRLRVALADGLFNADVPPRIIRDVLGFNRKQWMAWRKSTTNGYFSNSHEGIESGSESSIRTSPDARGSSRDPPAS